MIALLEAPEIEIIDHSATDTEKFWRRVPIFGGMITAPFRHERARSIIEKIDAQLRQRPENVCALWSDEPAKVAFAKEICELIAQQMD